MLQKLNPSQRFNCLAVLQTEEERKIEQDEKISLKNILKRMSFCIGAFLLMLMVLSMLDLLPWIWKWDW